jgi:PAS domain S-box-containing protein
MKPVEAMIAESKLVPGADESVCAFINEAPIPIAMFDHEMRYLAVSPRWLAAFGADERNVIGRSLYDQSSGIPPRWKDVHRRLLAGEAPKPEQDEFVRQDGSKRWITWQAQSWHQSSGGIGGITIFAEDVTAAVETELALRASNTRIAVEANALSTFHAAGVRVWSAPGMREGLDEMLATLVETLGADMGHIQLFDERRKLLHLTAQRGLNQQFLEFFRRLPIKDSVICGRVLRTRKPVVVEDIETDAEFAPFRSVARAAGIRSIIALPLIARHQKRLGVMSAHFRSPRSPCDAELARMALYADLAAAFIERSRSEDAMRENEQRLRLAIESNSLAMWDWDMKSDVITLNDEHYRMLGYGVGEVEPSYGAWMARLHPDDCEAAGSVVRNAVRERRDYRNEFRVILPDGSVRWCRARGRYLYDDRDPVRMIGLMEDVTEARRQAEMQRLLVGELQHRTRNLITIVAAIASQTMTSAESLEDFESRFNSRLEALSRVQGLISHADEGSIAVGQLVRMELEALGPDLLDGVTLAGPDILLRNDAVEMLSLAIHELATNALKYGALACQHGRLFVTWRFDGAEPDRRVVLEWIERDFASTPATSAHSARRGYGRTLIEEALPYSLSAQTSFDLGKEGLRCTISLPLVKTGTERGAS